MVVRKFDGCFLRIKGNRASEGELRWQQDAVGNFVGRVTFPGITLTQLDVAVELAVDIRPVNLFDFTVDDVAKTMPLPYSEAQRRELAPFLDLTDKQLDAGEKQRSGSPAPGGSGST